MKFKILALIFIVFAVFIIILDKKTVEKPEIFICNVGQGDGVVIRSQTGKIVIIDGGPDRKILDCIDNLNFFKSKVIDLMILTHPHKDHVAGLLEILDRYKVGRIISTKEVGYENDEYKVFRQKTLETSIMRVKMGDNLFIDENLRLEVLWPAEDYTSDNVNDISLVTRVVYGQSCFLLTGDAGKDFEKFYVNNFRSCEGLKVAHHGSKFSTGEEFLAKLGLNFAVISSGENNYGHPSPDVVDRLNSAQARILRTDFGTVKIVSDGVRWYIADTK